MDKMPDVMEALRAAQAVFDFGIERGFHELGYLPLHVIHAYIARLTAENAELRGDANALVDRCERMTEENSELRGIVADWRTKAATFEAELEASRETVKRLNRRVQVAEAGVAEKVKGAAPGSLGRALANAAADMLAHERDDALAELAAVRKRIEDSGKAIVHGADDGMIGMPIGPHVLAYMADEDVGKTVRLLVDDGDAASGG